MKQTLLVLTFLTSLTSYSQSKVKLPECKKMIIGKWQSIDDKKSFMVFTKTATISYYEKILADDKPIKYTVTSDINLDCIKLTEITPGDDDPMEYCIEKITASKLVLRYLARGNLLQYKRVK